MKTLSRSVLFAFASFGLAHIAVATSQVYMSGTGGSGLCNQWTINVPAGTLAHSYVVAQCGEAWMAAYQFTDQSWVYIYTDGGLIQPQFEGPNGGSTTGTGFTWSQDPNPESNASIQAGIAGPPAGEVYLAQTSVSGFSTTGTDEKWATLVGGDYTIWHGGGVGGSGMVTAVTDLTW